MSEYDLVEVYSVRDQIKAEIIKTVLEGEGIRAFLDGENLGGLAYVFDIRILVPAPDHDRAREIILSHEEGE